MKTETYFVVMAGGKGERLWPLVRKNCPKVCVRPTGKQTLLEGTLERLKPTANPSNSLIVTTKEQTKHIKQTLSKKWHRSILAEPIGKNTAAAITFAASYVAKKNPNAVMAVLPADHWIKKPGIFRKSLNTAIKIASDKNCIALIGLRPKKINAGLGHMLYERQISTIDGCRTFQLTKFIEKPSEFQARRLLKNSGIFWNSGIFVAKVSFFTEMIKKFLPQHGQLFHLKQSSGKSISGIYKSLKAISFDNGVMKHINDAIIVEGKFAWDDLGSWESWVRLGKSSAAGLALSGRGLRVISQKPHLVVSIGLNNLIVVNAPDATLICEGKSSQLVRHIPNLLDKNPYLRRYI